MNVIMKSISYFMKENGLGSMKLMNNGKHLVVGDKEGGIYFLDYILKNLKNPSEEDRNNKSKDQKRLLTKISNLVDLS